MMHSRLIDSKDIVFSSNNIRHVRMRSCLLRLISPNTIAHITNWVQRNHWKLLGVHFLHLHLMKLYRATSLTSVSKFDFISITRTRWLHTRILETRWACTSQLDVSAGIWSFVSDLPVIDRIGSLLPILKNSNVLTALAQLQYLSNYSKAQL